jgi:hypothetical protein
MPRDKRRLLRWSLWGSIAVAVGIQLIPISRTNPPVETEIQTPPGVREILRRSCYDCHSNETVWPWYSHVAPVAWLVASDVNEARRHMDFSTWNRYTAAQQSRHVGEIWDEVSQGEMPPSTYLLMHRNATLTDQDRQTLRTWTEAAGSPNGGR